MNVLLNLLFAVLAFVVARYVLALLGLNETVGLLIALVVAVVVFLHDFAARVHH